MEVVGAFLGVVAFLAIVYGLPYAILAMSGKKDLSREQLRIDALILGIWFISVVLFAGMKFIYSHDYFEQIDPVDDSYSPINSRYQLTLGFYFLVNILAIFQIWKHGRKLPPLLFVLCIIAMIWWVVVCVLFFIQFSGHGEENWKPGDPMSPHTGLIWFPIIQIGISLVFFVRVVRDKTINSTKDYYKSRFLNFLNNKIAASENVGVWVLILFLPVSLLAICVLQLFGQSPDSLIKAFTETTQWNLSQHHHPPFLDHKGHYLCTVAACGSPNIVQPIGIGKRHGHPIVVNRQLQIANAFECVLERYIPKIHKPIRKTYDKHGYPLSKKINHRFGSNVTYLLMKPLEWLFLIFIYLIVREPEKLIRRQYMNSAS